MVAVVVMMIATLIIMMMVVMVMVMVLRKLHRHHSPVHIVGGRRYPDDCVGNWIEKFGIR